METFTKRPGRDTLRALDQGMAALPCPVQPAKLAGDPIPKGIGIVSILSNHSVDETVERNKNILQAKGIVLFARMDHSGEAEKVGMQMRPTKLLIFGSPKAGTPLMLAAPTIAIDLPLKILVCEDAEGKVWLAYNSPDYLQQRYNLPANLIENIAVVGSLAAAAGKGR